MSEALASIGGDYDVEVGADAVVFTLTTLARFIDEGADLFADMTTRPSLREADFERVRQLRRDRLRQLKDVPSAVAERAFLRLVYGQHPYGHLSIGDEPSLAALSLDRWWRPTGRRFRPANATLIVAGGLPVDALLRSAERAFGALAGAIGLPPRRRRPIAAGAASGTRLALVPREGAAQSELRIGRLAARRDTPDYPALVVMNAVLGGQFVSRINLKLREEKGYTYGARTGFDWRKGLAPFVLHASVHTASTGRSRERCAARVRGAPRGTPGHRRGAGAGQGVADPRVSAKLPDRAAGGPRRRPAGALRPARRLLHELRAHHPRRDDRRRDPRRAGPISIRMRRPS